MIASARNIQVLVAIVAAAAMTAVAATAHEGDSPMPPGEGVPQVTVIETAAREATSVLATARTTGDALPTNVAEHFGANADFGMNPDLSRRAIGGTSSVFLVPANDHICAALTVGVGASVSCQETEELAAGEVGAATVTLEGGAIAVYGIVPDDVDSVAIAAGGESTNAEVVDNAYLAVLPQGAPLETLSYRGPSGPVDFPIYDPQAVLSGSGE
jgi:hypothetical protein